ncbi:MAG: methyltransferase domain-containing protein [Candidatus Hodarchaeota archaeon]
MKRTIKNFLNNLLAHLPGYEAKAKNIYRRLRYEKRNLVLKFKILFQKYHIPDPEQIYWIDPNRIMYHTNYIKNDKIDFKDRVFDMVRDKGRVYPGDWDLSSHKFTDLDVYKAIEQRILHGKEWEETIFYKTELAQIEAGETTWSCHNREDWDERCRSLDLLIQSIRENGYVFAHELKSGEGTLGPFLRNEMTEEITVNIGRDGQYLFQDGRHRLSIAKLLGLKVIPVKVLVRHKKWQELREELISMTKPNLGATKFNMLYQPAIHPDLHDIPASHLCEDRFLAMKKSLTFMSGIVLDLGANLGYFCHKFEDLGFNCYAIENDPQITAVANKIKIAEGKSFNILTSSIFDPCIQKQILEQHFDIVIALNIFHHFLKTKAIFLQFKKWLPKLSLKTMFFQPHLHSEEQMNNSYLNFTEEEFVQFILRETSLNDSEIIHKAADGRHVYRLY